ncbi:hypothetical protein L7F22_043363 [Adiantum nelumboides]|nr:hypothetical protein [Adiantum nelumboides]
MTLLTIIQSLEVFMKWGLDFMGPFKKVTPEKNKYIVMATHYVYKWVKSKALPNNIAKSLAWFLYEHIVCRYGCPIEIFSDQHTQYFNDTIEILTEIFSIKHRKSTPYYLRCNGQTESSNKTIKTILTKIVQNEPYNSDEQLQTALWAYRTAYKVTTGMTPFRMVYGIEAVVPLEFAVPSLRMAKQYNMGFNTILKTRLEELQRLDEIRQRALLEQQIVQQRRKYWHDSKIKVKEFKKGYVVLLYQSKLGPKKPNLKIAWSGPYEVDWVFSNGTIQLKDLSGLILPRVYNGAKMKLYYSPPTGNGNEETNVVLNYKLEGELSLLMGDQ